MAEEQEEEAKPERSELSPQVSATGSGTRPPRKNAIGSGDDDSEFTPEPGDFVLCSVLRRVSDLFLVKETTTQAVGYLSAPGKQLAVGELLICEFVRMENYGPLFCCINSDARTDADRIMISSEASRELSILLDRFSGQPGVVGSLIVGHDQLIIASNLPPELDHNFLAKLSLQMFKTTSFSCSAMAFKKVHQIVCITKRIRLIIADFGGGLLVVVMDDKAESIIPTMRQVASLIVA